MKQSAFKRYITTLNQVYQPRGGLWGHILRRFFHMSLALVPVLVYFGFHLQRVTDHRLLTIGIIAVLVMIIVLEVLRMRYQYVLYSQRSNEKRRISSFTWGALGLSIVLLLSPSRAFAFPIIWIFAFVDPLLGELRLMNVRPSFIYLISYGCGLLICLACYVWFGTPLWFCWLILPLALIVESISNRRWIDDNASIQIVPLLAVLLVTHL